MNLDDGLALMEVRPVQDHLTVESSGAQKRRIQHFQHGGHHDNNGARGLETIHLDQELIECTFVIREERPAIRTALADCVPVRR